MRRHFVLALIVVLVAGTAVAQDDEDPFLYWHDYKPPDPSKTLLLAERADVARVKAARTGSVLSGYDLTRHQHATVADGLIEAPAVYVERRRLWLQSPVLRGLSGPRVMLMIDDMLADGMLWPDAPYEDMAYIDPQATGRVEVLRGSASSIYGSGAMGGLVSAETVLRQDFRTDFDFSSSMLGRIDTASREQFVSMALESNATDFLGSIGVLSFGDIKNHDAGGGLGERKGNAYRRQDYTFSFNVPVRGRLAVDAIAQVHRINRADGADVLYDRVRIHESGRDLYRLRAKAMELGAVLNWIELSGGAYTRYRHRSLEAEGADSPFIDRERTISGQGRAAVSLRFGRFLETLWGADGVLDRYEGKRDGPGSTPPPLPEDSRADRLGLWTELRFSPLSWLHIVPAGRVEWLWAGARREIAGMGARSIAYYTHEEAWSASGVFDVGERFHLFGRIENAFRFPGMVELAGLETAQGPLYVPATDIVSEKLLSGEAGFRYDDGRSMVNASASWASLTDGIYYAGANIDKDEELDGRPFMAARNGAQLILWTMEADARFRLGLNWMFTTQIAYQWAEDVDASRPADGVPPFFGSALLRWNSDDERLAFEPYVEWAAPQHRVGELEREHPAQGRETPPYITYNARVVFEVTRYIRVLMEGRNLSDKRYRMHGGTEFEPGRSFTATLQLHF